MWRRQRTRIAFLGQVRFAAITKLRVDTVVCSFPLPYALDSALFARVKEVVPDWFVHTLVATANRCDRQTRRPTLGTFDA